MNLKYNSERPQPPRFYSSHVRVIESGHTRLTRPPPIGKSPLIRGTLPTARRRHSAAQLDV